MNRYYNPIVQNSNGCSNIAPSLHCHPSTLFSSPEAFSYVSPARLFCVSTSQHEPKNSPQHSLYKWLSPPLTVLLLAFLCLIACCGDIAHHSVKSCRDPFQGYVMLCCRDAPIRQLPVGEHLRYSQHLPITDYGITTHSVQASLGMCVSECSRTSSWVSGGNFVKTGDP